MRRIPKLLVAAFIVLPLLATAGLNAAVAGSTQSGTLRGKVVDEKGQPLPGVIVTLQSDALIRDRTTVTDAEGNFFAATLPPGKYSVTTQLTGYLTIASDTQVEIDKTTVLDSFIMKEGELRETVTVTATKPFVDKTKTEQSTVIDKTFADQVPAGRNYQSLIEFAPGVGGDRGADNPNILGGTSNSNIYLVDGISSRDPVTGTFGLNLNFDAVDTVDTKLTGISAEYGETQGGLANILTKSGSNEFTGSLRDVVSAPSWTKLYNRKSQEQFAERISGVYHRPAIPGRSSLDDNKTNRISATLGGPIVSDTAWFFLAYDRPDRTDTAALGNPIGGPSANGTYGDFFEGDFSVGKVTWQVTNNHKLLYQYSEDPAHVSVCYGQEFFGGACYEDYNVDLQFQGGFQYIGTWSATWTPKFITELKYARFKNGFGIDPLAPIPTHPGLPVGQLGRGGPAPAIDLFDSGATFDANIFGSDPEDRLRTQYEGSATTFFDTKNWGTHQVKIGADYHRQTQTGQSVLAGDALFYFQFPDTDGDTFIDNPPPGLGGNGNPYDINNRTYYLWYDFAAPVNAGPVNKYSVLYVQDDWDFNEHFSFNLGARYEKSDNENDVGEKIIDSSGIAPRLGVAWDITGQGKHIVKATAGRYLAGINLVTLSPFVRAAGGQSSYDLYVNADYVPRCPAAGCGPQVAGPPNWVLIAQVRPDPGAATFAPGIDPQRFDELTAGYEYQITPTIGVKSRLLYRKWKDIVTQSFTYEYPGGIPRKISLIDNNSDAKRNFKGAILEMEKRLSDNWELKANYIYSKSEGNVTTDSGFDTFQSYSFDVNGNGNIESNEYVPQTVENRFGKLPWDSTHQFKLQGYYSIPLHSTRHGLSVGAIYDYRSGNPYAANNTQVVTVGPGPDGVLDGTLGQLGAAGDDQTDSVAAFFEPRGTRREPFNQELDFLGKYNFAFNKDVNFETRLEVFNVTNEQRPFSVTTRAGALTFGHPSAYSQFQAPRAYRVQFAIMW